MLQPLQLRDVSVRYAKEIVELRDFLEKAGCGVETVESLSGIAARLPRDRAFRRDLTSYIWVVIDGCKGEISYSDLLGMVAIAAAGTRFAAAAHEDDAHGLLRFLMEARRSLDMAPDDREGSRTRWSAEPEARLSAEPLQPEDSDEREVSGGPEQILSRDANSLKVLEEIEGERRRVPWLVAAGCLVVALSVGLWLKSRPAAVVGSTPASGTAAVAGSVSSTVRPSEAGDRATVHSPSKVQNLRVMPLRPAVRSSRQTSTTASSAIPRATEMSPLATATAAHGPVAPVVEAAPPHPLRSAGIASTGEVRLPRAGSSGSLGTPGTSSIPTNASEQGRDIPAARTSGPPIVLRRRPPASSSGDSEDGALVSEVRPADVPNKLGSSRTGGVDGSQGGTVRLTTLGTMAANVMYSPMPTYPAAASASHVQGEVKLRAEVDRDGNVASVRVISGPPLLRDAALDAVQRWRYRPYMSSGEPTPMTAITIVDFELP